ncbi:MAG: AMP-binding protein [Spirochaetia bacterium]|nr:AMP-binding protein [Spirochaetota bacterium]MCX8096965.1 AMP-binding protein [Spirochaetota bacterium]MDW8112394.1 AMP-binding protein [Spirochaetia bacterium]
MSIASVEPDIKFLNAREFVDYIAEKYQDKRALGMPVSEDNLEEYIWYTYSDIKKYAQCISYYLSNVLKLKKGDKVALISENRAEWGLCALGTVYNGFVLVPMDVRMSPNEIKMILEHSESKVVFVSQKMYSTLEDEINFDNYYVIMIDEKPKKKNQTSLRKIIEEYSDKVIKKYNEVSPDDLFEIVYTSGTTGLSKGVMLTHRNIMFELTVLPPLARIKPTDRLLSILPLNHTYESTAGLYTALHGGTSILYSPALNPKVVLELISRNKINKMLVVPLFLEKIADGIIRKIERSGVFLKAFVKTLFALATISRSITKNNKLSGRFLSLVRKKAGLSTIELFISGAAPLPERVANLMELMGFTILQGYGLTECAPVATLNPYDKPKNKSVGKPIPGVEITIDAPNKDGIGEILIKGPNVMVGYYKNPTATQETLVNGYLKTGDLGYIDEEGYVYITGRIKNVIVTHGGKNVYPEEIEEKLNESPYILESLVIGKKISKDEAIGEEVFAYIVPDFNYIEFEKETPAHKISYEDIEKIIDGVVKELNTKLPDYKKIKSYKILTEELPKTSTRKIKRYLFQQQDSL